MSNPNPQYNDNNVPFAIPNGPQTVKRGGTSTATTIGIFIFENLTLNAPGKVGERPDPIGAPNGWWLVRGFPTASGVMQLATTPTPRPDLGDWFQNQFDGSPSGVSETWVIVDRSDPYEISGYYKANVTLRKAFNPPS